MLLSLRDRSLRAGNFADFGLLRMPQSEKLLQVVVV